MPKEIPEKIIKYYTKYDEMPKGLRYSIVTLNGKVGEGLHFGYVSYKLEKIEEVLCNVRIGHFAIRERQY